MSLRDLNNCNMLKSLGIKGRQRQSDTQDLQTEASRLRKKLKEVQERNTRWADEKCEWVQQRAKLCHMINKLQCDLAEQHELLKKANNSEPSLQTKASMLEAEREKVAGKESAGEAISRDPEPCSPAPTGGQQSTRAQRETRTLGETENKMRGR